MPKQRWMPAQIEEVRKMAPTMTASEIGKALKESRNAIIGVCHREGITLGAYAKKHGMQASERRTRQHGPLSINFKKKYQAMPKLSTAFNKKPIAWPPEFGKCGYIIGDVSRHTKCCGDNVKHGSVYCQNHHTACYGGAR